MALAQATIFVLENLPHAGRQLGTVAKPAEFFDHPASGDAGQQRRDAEWRYLDEEFHKTPAGFRADDDVLGFTNQGAYAADCGADGAMHEQAAQHGTELFEILAMDLVHIIICQVGIIVIAPGGNGTVINLVEADRYGDQHRKDGQRIKKRGKHRYHDNDDQIEGDPGAYA